MARKPTNRNLHKRNQWEVERDNGPMLSIGPHISTKRPGLISGFLLGVPFAFGSTPCIGPILATVLAIPFLLTALGIRQFLGFYEHFRHHFHCVELFSGSLLLLVGDTVFLNRLTSLSGKVSFLNRFSL